MKKLYLLLLLCCAWSYSQTLELTPTGFAPLTLPTPNKPLDHLIESAKTWALTYNKGPRDVYNVSTNTLSIDAWREYAFFYRNLGDRYDNNIVYTLQVVFNENNTFTTTFIVKEIYAKDVLTKTKVGDYFNPTGSLKQEFAEVKPSLEATANKIVRSFLQAVSN